MRFLCVAAACILASAVARADGPPPRAATADQIPAAPIVKPDPEPPVMALPEGSAAVPINLLQLLFVYLDGRSEASMTLQRQVGTAIQAKPKACPTK